MTVKKARVGARETIPLWQRGPKAGARWRSRQPIETRTVVDRTFGGDVIYVSGRRTRFARHVTCTYQNWCQWVLNSGAKQVRE